MATQSDSHRTGDGHTDSKEQVVVRRLLLGSEAMRRSRESCPDCRRAE